ncbi:MAG TPA: MoaD/ThiS family protein [Candidatus Acidoferrales bacterium]|nr:MoaD/ThiS family protein [Candidatus Acidoferrales bacterium]
MLFRVHVSYLGLVRNVIGQREEEIEIPAGTTVKELLAKLEEKYGEPFRASVFKGRGELRGTAQVCIDDRDITDLQGLETRLAAKEKITILVGVYPPEGG